MDKKIKSILIIRLSAIGDIVMATPLISQLQKLYPNARISWLVQSGNQGLLEYNGQLHEVLVWRRSEWALLREKGQWLNWVSEVRKFIKLLRSKDFDLVLDCQGLLKSGLWARLSGAPVRIGLGSKEGSQYLMTQVIEKEPNNPLIGSEYRQLVKFLGGDLSSFEMDLPLSESILERQNEIILQNLLQPGYVVICPFTTRPQKHWLDSHWLDLSQKISALYGFKVVMLGGPADQAHATTIVDQHPSLFVNLVGQTSLELAAALIRGSNFLVGVDTGLTHMGIAYNRPTVTLFGSTCPYLDTGHKNTVVIYKNLECSPCRRNPTCDGVFTCLTKITADEVIEKIGLVCETGNIK